MNRPAAKTLYVVYWPTEHIVKIGIAGHMARVRRFTDTGAQVLVLMQGRSVADETAALAAVGKSHSRAFTAPTESSRLLGFRGSGYSECFTVATDELPSVVDVVLEAIAIG